jgi:hypothetical protein
VDRSDAGQGHKQQESNSEFWTAKLTDWLLALFTLFLVVFNYRLWKSTEKLWSAGEKQIGIGSQMAGIAEKQLAILALQTDIQLPSRLISKKSSMPLGDCSLSPLTGHGLG